MLTNAVVFVVLVVGAAAQAVPELGRVAWARELEPALVRAKGDGRPVLLLFQEVPG